MKHTKLTPAESRAALALCNAALRGGDAKTIILGKAGKSLMSKLIVRAEADKLSARAAVTASKSSKPS